MSGEADPAVAPRGDPHPYIDQWDEYWLEMARTASRKSKDPKCRVGAVIVCHDTVVSTGFNGFPRQVFDNPELLADPDEKLRMICHAEQNAIYNAARIGVSLQAATIYVTKFPCLGCCNAIIQAGMTTIYTHDSKFWNDDPLDPDHARKRSVLRQAGIKVIAPLMPAGSY
jgi:dCMP deaminase